MGDLVVGARSGSGEPDGRDVPVQPAPGDAAETSDTAACPQAQSDVPEVDGGAPSGADPQPGKGESQDGVRGADDASHTTAKDPVPPVADVESRHAGTLPGGSVNGLAADAEGSVSPDGPLEVSSSDSSNSSDEPKPGEAPDEGSEEEQSAARKAKKPRSFWKELPILIIIALVLALGIKTFFVQAFSIPSNSMQNTLQKGDRVLVDKLTPWFGSKPERGEVVVFHDPGGWLDGPTAEQNPVQKALSFIGLMPSSEEKDLIKRVIAVGGDTVECSGDGPVKVNGKPLDEPYIFPGAKPCSDRPFGPITIPEGRLWVMGDHRNDSLDSRYHQNLPGKGTIDEDQVVGRAFVVAWPISRWSTLPVPGTFDQNGLAAPAALGLVGAIPLTWLNRRRVLRGQSRQDADTTA